MPRCKSIEYDGKMYDSISQVAEITGVDYKKLMYRINRGMHADDAVLSIQIKEEEEEKKRNEVKAIEESKALKIEEDAKTKEKIESVIDKFSSNASNKPEMVKIEEDDSTIDPKAIEEPHECDNIHSSVWARPNYDEVKTPAEAISKIGNASVVNLIDYENVYGDKELLKEYINEDNTVNIFFYNATKYSNQFFNIIKGCTNNNLQVHIFECGNQVVDHLITYYLGAIHTAYPDKTFNIISKDTGFYGFISSLCSPKINGIGINYIEDKEIRYKYSLCKYIAGSDKLFKHRDLISTRELAKLFEPFYNRKLSNSDVLDLSESLIKFKIAKIVSRSDFTWIKFDMVKINNFVEEYKW